MTKPAALTEITNRLRREGWQPYFNPQTGRLIDWRRIKSKKLQRCEVKVRPSGRVTVHHRSADA